LTVWSKPSIKSCNRLPVTHTIWDPELTQAIRQEKLHHGADYTPYEGMEITGWPTTVIVRGGVVVEDGAITGQPGHGAFLKRDLSPFAKPRGKSWLPARDLWRDSPPPSPSGRTD